MYGSSKAVIRGLSCSNKISPKRQDPSSSFKNKQPKVETSKFTLTAKTSPKKEKESAGKRKEILTTETVTIKTEKVVK